MKNWTREEGKHIGKTAAEGFIQHLGNGHPRDNILILKTILKDRCIEL